MESLDNFVTPSTKLLDLLHICRQFDVKDAVEKLKKILKQYYGCAEFQCKEKGVHLTGVKIKDVLGDNVFEVICPLLWKSEFFAKFVGLSNLLHVTDPYEIYQFLESSMNNTEANAEARINSEDLFLTSALMTTTNAAKTTFRESVFTEDILPVMLDNPEILTVKDLFNFRLVNRCWRDAATSVLLKQNLGVISLNAIPVILPPKMVKVRGIFEYINSDQRQIINSVIYCNDYQNKLRRLSELSQLIYTSPKFPCDVIRFDSHFSDGIKSLSSASDCDGTSTNTEHQDLFQFVSLYGKKIKKLSLSRISEKAVQNLLYVHMPHLHLLDIDGFSLKEKTHVEEDSQPKMFISSLPTLELKEISVGGSGNYYPESYIKYDFVEALIRVSPNCVAIKKVNVKLLGVLLQMEKCHLIKDVQFDPTVNDMSTIQQLATLLTDSILGNNVPSLKLTISEIRVDFYYFLRNAHLNTCTVVHALNLLLSAPKDFLKYLEFKRGSYCKELEIVIDLFIPPLPRLVEQLYLDTGISWAVRFNFLGDVIREAVQAGQVGFTSDSLISQTRQNCNIPANYFPNLRKMVLGQLGTADNSANLRQFFSLHQHLGPDGLTRMSGDTLLTFTSLVLKLELRTTFQA